jgi:hypothetical protein
LAKPGKNETNIKKIRNHILVTIKKTYVHELDDIFHFSCQTAGLIFLISGRSTMQLKMEARNSIEKRNNQSKRK